jgi:RecA/RadA recombinase
MGRYYWVAGHSSSGKTFLALTTLAEASINPAFDRFDFIYDDVEDGALMDMERFFGKRMVERLMPPRGTKAAPEHSHRIEEFYANIDDRLELAEKKGRQFIYVLDSMDALDSKYAEAKFKELKTEIRGGQKAKGDYGDGKAKINSQRIRNLVSRLRKTDSILIVLSQARDNIDGGMFDPEDVYAGGRALRFYSTVQITSRHGSKLKKKLGDKEVVVGSYCDIQLTKNRLNGTAYRSFKMPIYYDVGIDDVGSLVDYLVEWGRWPKNKQGVIDASADWGGVAFTREKLIQWIDTNDMREDLETLAAETYASVQARLAITRKNKYQ